MEKFTRAFSKSAEQSMTFAEKASYPDNVIPTPLSYRKGKVIDVGKSSYEPYKNKGEVQEFKDVEFTPLCERKDEMLHKHHCKQSEKGGEVVEIFPHARASIGKSANAQNKLKSNALEFVPLVANKSSEECSEAVYKCSHDRRIGNVVKKSLDRKSTRLNSSHPV